VTGSDYPVLLAFETYRQTFHYIREAGLPAADVDQILYHNAQRLLEFEHPVEGLANSGRWARQQGRL
jgi:predicted TIM-barrel fold metal-dependent hydrolase